MSKIETQNTMETMKISELVALLEAIKMDFGDLHVVLSSDSEGNSFGTIIGSQDLGVPFTDEEPKVLRIYPWNEGLMEDDFDNLVDVK